MHVTVYQDEHTKEVNRVEVDGLPPEDGFVALSVSSSQALPANVVTELCPTLTRDVDKALRKFFALRKDEVLAAVPWSGAHLPPGCSSADVTTYVMPADALPAEKRFFPLNWRYGSGYTLVEIEPTLDAATGVCLTAEFFLSKQFNDKVDALVKTLRGPNNLEDVPGFVLPDTLKHLAPFADAGPADPLLRAYDPLFSRTGVTKLRLQASDFAAICVGDWSRCSKDTQAMAGHTPATQHYYLLVKWCLPPECVDQLKMLVFLNPHKDTWGKLVERKPFERAVDTAEHVRHSLVRRLLSGLGLEAKKAAPHFTDTVFDVFDDNVVNVSSPNGDDRGGVSFFAGCTPVHRSSRGVVVDLGPSREDGWLWLHGPSTGAKLGGASWKQPLSANSLPVVAASKLTKKTLTSFAAAGWEQNAGFVKLVPIQYV